MPPLLPRFSQMVQDKPLRTSWQRKMKERQERKLAKDFARHLEEEKQRRRQVMDIWPRLDHRGQIHVCCNRRGLWEYDLVRALGMRAQGEEE